MGVDYTLRLSSTALVLAVDMGCQEQDVSAARAITYKEHRSNTPTISYGIPGANHDAPQSQDCSNYVCVMEQLLSHSCHIGLVVMAQAQDQANGEVHGEGMRLVT